MASDPIQWAARAIAAIDAPHIEWSDLTFRAKETYREMAKAAIEAAEAVKS